MATFSDLMDWLNQGAQGDIPGTGGSQPSPSSSSQSAQPVGDTPAVPDMGPKAPGPTPPSAYRDAAQPATPQDYSGDIPPTLLPHYNALVQSGLPPSVAYSIMTQPSVGEGDYVRSPDNPWPYAYQGEQQEAQARAAGPPRDADLNKHMWDSFATRQQNLPTYEGHTPGDDDNLGFTRLPSGQYVPWSQQANPAAQSDEMQRTLQAWGEPPPADDDATNMQGLLQMLGFQ